MLILGFDVSKKKLGVAKWSSEINVLLPIKVIQCGSFERVVVEMKKVIQSYSPDIVVIGLPRHADGKLTDNGRFVKKVVEELRKEIGEVNFEFVNERYTSKLAQGLIEIFDSKYRRVGDRSTKKGKKELKRRKGKGNIEEDSVAACLILERYLRENGYL